MEQIISIRKAIAKIRFLPLSKGQAQTLSALCKGEEGEFFRKKIAEIHEIWRGMPCTYETDGEGLNAVAYLHYTLNAWDWYITERDADPDGLGQQQAFGLVCGFERELGYISLEEITAAGAELDLNWDPKPLREIPAKF
ncbi:MAG: hypothetical protein RE468_08965 [Acidithiobacillus caldus]|uniref:DUF2958 domain-containing protein n=1 Tax=Acidithiobacillus caldus TaxID=33059 RepID=A0A1E7YP47_9PROT|nr:hypothetical protein [Acidithiobacillus caldus]MBU2802169.1 hypothetical protein [Acidithiobacillus caldus]OFC37025.1 hypothetical protein BAE29_12070 [Acidithiobacillus caldus]OFC37289.1 hypothetical protein BAE27_04310 [Acidithiobacillus caldus]OFC39369.1 hypothetical protein BAE28_03685 [Acidithiobacillus caldus]WMT46038.1 MAG: hypothetical protein RE468_08965 [Acidithiobacillus caldus]